METDDLLCSRNAWPPKDGKGSLAVLLLPERARSECARLGMRRVSACPGRAGEKVAHRGSTGLPLKM
jgi:hypothetical protein